MMRETALQVSVRASRNVRAPQECSRSHRASVSQAYPGLFLVCIVLGVIYLHTMAPTLTWANDGADGGDFVASAATFGVAHPTGYPTYILLLRLFLLLPVGDLAFRANLLSAAAAIGAAICLFTIVRQFDVTRHGWSAPIAALAGGLAPVFWSQASIAEVYTLNALFAGLTLRFILAAEAGEQPVWWHGLVIGLALGVHITVALLAAVWLIVVVIRASAGSRVKVLLRGGLSIAPGLLVYLYLPVAAAAHPPVNWGAPDTWEGFWWVISGTIYRELPFGLPAQLLYGRVTAWAALLREQFGLLGLGVGLFGMLYGAAERRRFVRITIGLAIVYSIFAITYNTADSYAYLIPAYLIFAVWIGIGLIKLTEIIASRYRAVALVLAMIMLAALVWSARVNISHVDASRDTRAADFAQVVLAQAPHRAIIMTEGDRDTFALWYYHYAVGERPDIVVLSRSLLEQRWYRENLRAVYPALRVPERLTTSWATALATANPTLGPICRTYRDGRPELTCTSE